MSTKKTLAEIVLAAGLASGSVYAAEKSGLTDAFVQYSDMKFYAAQESHKRWPYIVWSDYGPDTKYRLTRYRIAYDAQFAFLGVFLGFWGMEAGCRKLKKIKNSSPDDTS